MQSETKTQTPWNRFQEIARWKGERRKVVISRRAAHHGLGAQLSLTHSCTPGNSKETFPSLGDHIPPRNVQTGIREGNSSVWWSCKSRGLLIPSQLPPNLPSVRRDFSSWLQTWIPTKDHIRIQHTGVEGSVKRTVTSDGFFWTFLKHLTITYIYLLIYY